MSVRPDPDGDVTLAEIFRDTNLVKVQFLASALDDAGVPFTLHETWDGNVELGGQEMRLLVRESDVDEAREVIREGIAELPSLREAVAMAAEEDPDEPAADRTDGPPQSLSESIDGTGLGPVFAQAVVRLLILAVGGAIVLWVIQSAR